MGASEAEGHVVRDRGSPAPVKSGWVSASGTSGASLQVTLSDDFPCLGAGSSTAGAGTVGGSSLRRPFTHVGFGRVGEVPAISWDEAHRVVGGGSDVVDHD